MSLDDYKIGVWPSLLRRMRRVDPVYKPAALLVVLDLLDAGTAAPETIPLALAGSRFDELLARCGLLSGEGRDAGRAYQPLFHLSSASRTPEVFWDLLLDGDGGAGPVVAPAVDPPSSMAGLLKLGSTARLVTSLRPAAETVEGREAIRAAIYELLQRDGRPDCWALLAGHDRDAGVVDEQKKLVVARGALPFVLDDSEATKIVTHREVYIRDRALRGCVLDAYGRRCALCGGRVRWNRLDEVEAAHIKPRADRGPDDVRNALSLCRTHHWAFDLGLWAARPDGIVLVREALERRTG